MRDKRIRRVEKNNETVFQTFMFVDVLSNVDQVTHLAQDVAQAAITKENEMKQLQPTEQVVY